MLTLEAYDKILLQLKHAQMSKQEADNSFSYNSFSYDFQKLSLKGKTAKNHSTLYSGHKWGVLVMNSLSCFFSKIHFFTLW